MGPVTRGAEPGASRVGEERSWKRRGLAEVFKPGKDLPPQSRALRDRQPAQPLCCSGPWFWDIFVSAPFHCEYFTEDHRKLCYIIDHIRN